METYEQFRKNYDQLITKFSDDVMSFPWKNKEAYKGWVSQTYFYVKHSTRLLALAAARCKQNEEDLHKRFIAHLNEEKGHEVMAFNDLKNLGDHMDNYTEIPVTSLFYQNQYALIEHNGAQAFFGYVLALEGMAANIGKKIYQTVLAEHGQKATMFWKVHSEDDIEHIELALRQVEKMTSEQLGWVISSMEQSCYLYSEMLKASANNQCKKKLYSAAG